MSRHIPHLILLGFVAFCVGCGEPDYYTLSGTATKDGKPLPHLQITLAPDMLDSTRPPMAMSKEDGTFVMRCGRETGVPPGVYTFHIEDPGAADGRTTPKKTDPFYDDYMYVVERYSPANSDLKYTADSHQSSFELKLEEKEYTKPKVTTRKTRNTTGDPTGEE